MSKIMKQMMAEARLAKALSQPPSNPRRYSADPADVEAYATYQQAMVAHGGAYPTVYLDGRKCDMAVMADEVAGEVRVFTGAPFWEQATLRGQVHVLWEGDY
jgi:hypothetical protein